ncbi:hypothetical protein [Armatimonas sp.]|uniref:hypothetical protein n=1 Tax=Armatimonas sp. TaxID=1872638 RepID=UPI00286CBABD|nr:hypothetical protein [Armatimonas sp.]
MAVQQQREKPTSQAPRRSSVLEIVLGTLHFLLGGSYVVLMLISIQNDGIGGMRWYDLLPNVMATLMGLCTGLAGLLLLCRQRRVAVWLQWISTLAALIMSTIVLYFDWKQRTNPLSNYDWILLGVFCAIPLWMAGFAWFLKKQESEE